MIALIVVCFFSIPASGSWSPSGKELAKVNNHSISDRDLDLALGGLNQSQKDNFLKDDSSKDQILEKVIDAEVLAQEAEKAGLDQKADFKQVMASMRRELLAAKLLDMKLSSKMTTGATQAYYEKYLEKFTTSQVRVQHILLLDENEAKKVLALAKVASNDFQELAEKYSHDPSAKSNRGELGYISRDKMSEEFTDAAFSTRIGEVSQPVKTLFGYHLIKVIARKPGKPLEFYEVELRAREGLKKSLVEDYVSSLKDKATIVRNLGR
jgi:peptidyl-prolyl cis-trans isomerase C